MDEGTVSWLDLREEADRAARDPALAAAAAAFADAAEGTATIVDLGAGTGAMLRALAPLLSRPAHWRLVDDDPDLAAIAAARHPEVETVTMALAGNVLFPLADATLVTTADLVGDVPESFVARLVASLASRRAGFYAAGVFDGTVAFEPQHPLDEAVVAAHDRFLRADDGAGPALGPTAVEVLARTLDRAGYAVSVAKAPWRLGPGDTALAGALLRRLADAAAETLEREAVGDWLAFRLEAAETEHARLTVGHDDLFGAPL